MDLGLKDAHVVVFGASRGMGRAAARQFAAEGAKVALIARNLKGLEKTAAQCRDAGSPEVLCQAADMSDTEQVAAAIHSIGSHWGAINVLVNNAANSIGTHGDFSKFEDEEIYVDAFNRIVLGYVRATRAAIPYLKAAEWGRIVNISSTSTSRATPLLHVFNMMKAAMNNLSRSLAKELAPDGISVNLISPGGVMVENGNWGEVMNRYYEEAGLDPTNPYHAVELSKKKFGSTESNFMDRYGSVDEYGAAIVFAGSRVNSFMTGTNINVDGGSDF
ncbi:SDR family NAD(P)-dependent oxidoreductase [Novosphingobium malaysiense]|uniref:Short-chain dehydrogenase n=1 Tax=Novosphingobium malaysiense TaxID=1348853 RepID=A0A0B1ZD44_9SPHN|nr:SDR family NAD(P)-dependent oxidoreductase [Novosphingobium malaysiense]KHK88974.1 hypothetical protein LK12_23070 [Novosphingobium malaysiense]